MTLPLIQPLEKLSPKEVIKIELSKCIESPIYFMKRYCYIQHPKRGKILFTLYPFQEQCTYKFLANRFNIILKSRQLGISTLTAGFILWRMIFKKDQNILVLATAKDTAKNLVTKIRVMCKNLPSWIFRSLGVEIIEDNKLSLAFSNGSQVKAVSSKPESTRSEALSLLVVDEAAFIDKMDEVWKAAFSTLSEGGDCLVLSTPSGVGTWYHKMWQNSLSGESEFNPIKLHWSVHPERDQKWRDAQDKELGPRDARQECFDGDTRIYTRHGLVPIKDVNIGDFVLTHNGTFKKVINKFSKISDDVYEINSFLNEKSSFVTGNHPFLHNNEWTELCDVEDGSLLPVIPKNIKYQFDEIRKIDLYETTEPKYFKKSLNDDDTFYINDRKHKINHNRFIDVDYDLGYVVGLYLAEGSGDRLRKTFSFNREDDAWQFDLINIVNNKFGFSEYQIRNNSKNKGSNLSFCSEVFCQLIDQLVDGDRSYNKRLSQKSYEFNNLDYLKGVLDGVMHGDGMLKFKYNKKISVTSLDLIYDTKFISSLIGINCTSINSRKQNVTEHRILGRKIRKSHQQTILSYLGTSKKEIENITNFDGTLDILKHYQSRYNIDDEYVYSRISIRPTDEFVEVFNLEVEDEHTYVTEHFVVHNCDCDFLASGDSVINLDIVKKYEDTLIKQPVEKRGFDKNYWIWKYPEPRKEYIVSADVSRGDGSDYSACHVLDIETMEQVAEYKGMIDTKEYGNLLVLVAMEYNNALLVIERENIGWAVIQQVIDREYPNLFRMSKDLKYVDTYGQQLSNKVGREERSMVPGFGTTGKTRPLLVSKIEECFREEIVKIYSQRTVNELYTFIWKAGRAEAMSGENDDLLMALGIGLWIRDTALRLKQQGIELTKMALSGFRRLEHDLVYNNSSQDVAQGSWNFGIGDDENMDLRELL